MSPVPPPLDIILKFTSTRTHTGSSPSLKEEAYRVEDANGHGSIVHFRWDDPELQSALADLDKPMRKPEVLEVLGKKLEEFLRPSHWARDVDKIERALTARPPQPVHLTIRAANADELYALPWDLLPLPSGKRLVSFEHYLIQYECLPVPSRERPPHPKGRILFAWSCAGGGELPVAAHEKAIRSACQKAGFFFDPKQDVLHEVSRKSLMEKLADTGRPVTALHLLCHGALMSSGTYGVTLSSEESPQRPDRLDATEFRDLLFSSHGVHSLRLVALNSCLGGDAGTPGHVLGSVARMLHMQGVPAVLASRRPLSCSGSVVLAETLYDGLLVRNDNLRTVLFNVRRALQFEEDFRDEFSLRLYARAEDAFALTPFIEPPTPAPISSDRQLILIRHAAYSTVPVDPTPADAPTLFQGRQPRWVDIDQTPQLEQRDWKNLDAAVKRLASPEGELRRAYAERNADVAYYGFPFVPLAALAGHLAKNRQVHAFEYVSERFQWESGPPIEHPLMKVDVQTRESGDAARLRLSVSAPVLLDDCRQVLPDTDVRLDLHFALEAPKRGSVRREEQLKVYVQAIRDTLDKYVSGNPALPLKSIHVFAAVPVSVAFHLGHALAATWLPECFIYNYGKMEEPTYKWRLSLQAAVRGQRSIKIFK